MQSFGVLNVVAFQSCAWLGSEPNHLKAAGVFAMNSMKKFWHIFYVLGNISLNHSGQVSLTMIIFGKLKHSGFQNCA